MRSCQSASQPSKSSGTPGHGLRVCNLFFERMDDALHFFLLLGERSSIVANNLLSTG
jgi:hypothetical protein